MSPLTTARFTERQQHGLFRAIRQEQLIEITPGSRLWFGVRTLKGRQPWFDV
jgi:hypothetical protein